jgi:hypothetical protein
MLKTYNTSLNLVNYPQSAGNFSLWGTKSKDGSDRKIANSSSMKNEKSRKVYNL